MPEPGANPAPLRIAQLNSLLNGGGTDDQCLQLAQGQAQLGQQAWVAGPEGRLLSKSVTERGLAFCPTPPEGPLKVRFILSAANFVRRERIQIVHGHHGRDLWPAILAARLSGWRPKIVLTRHLAKSPGSWVSRRFLLGQCDALIAVSDFVARVLREGVYEPQSPEPERRARPPLLGDHSKIHVIYGGIDTSRFHPFDASSQREAWNLALEHFAFGVVGSYDRPRGKGQREFLEAAALVHEQVPSARFLIIGRGSLKEVLEADIARLGLSPKAWLTPYCRDMPGAMNALNCLVHPQIGTEAFPGVVLEAFACGKPVLASRLDGIPEAFAIANYGRLVEPGDVQSLAKAMLELARQPVATATERERIHKLVADRFSFQAMAASVLELYRKLL